MILTLENAARTLVSRGLLDEAAIVEGDVRIVDATRRNRNLKVHVPRGRSFFVKQPGDEDTKAEATLQREAAFYRFCRDDARAASIRPWVPRLAGWLPEEAVLTMDLVEDAVPLWQYTSQRRAMGLSLDIGPALATILATLHRLDPPVDLPFCAGLPRSAPWILWAHKPGPEILERVSQGNLQTIKILQQDGSFCRPLDELRRQWRPTALVHGDIKSDNLLARPPDASAGLPRLCVVDWELMLLGDPAWDVGSALHELLRLWITSIPAAAGRSAEEMAALAEHPLPWLQPTIRAFFRTYEVQRGLGPAESKQALLLATRCCAARLVQTAYESSQAMPMLSNHAVLMLQVAANVFRSPEGAVEHLFGLTVAP